MHDIAQNQVDAWKSQLKKGPLELAVLTLLNSKRRYGLELLEELNEHNLAISDGSIYPLLSRLRDEKKVTAEWVDEGSGHAHKYYQLTSHGKQTLQGMLLAWREYTVAIDRLINTSK